MAYPFLKRGLKQGPKLALVCALGFPLAGPAGAAEIFAGGGWEVRWDNSLRYSLALRANSPSAELLNYINGDDGDRNFTSGPVSNRLTLLSALDIAAGDFGVHVSATAWYDQVYQSHTDNNSPATYNAAVPARQFAPDVKSLQGQHAELSDAFAYGNFSVVQMPVSVRVGRQTLLGGESRFFDANSIAAAMAPTDYLKTMSDENGYSGNIFLPVTQMSLTVQPLSWLSLTFYDQFEWRASRQFGDGSFLSYVDYIGTGAAKLFLSPSQYLVRNPDRGPASGQYGFILRGSFDDMDLGFYALHFRAKDPVAALSPDPSLLNQSGAVGYYRLVYPASSNLYGLSFSTERDGNVLAGELSARENVPLVNYDARAPQYVAPTRAPYYPKGNTLHAQISLTTALAETGLWDTADAAAEIASDHILDPPAAAVGAPPYAHFGLKARARIEPHYFQVLPNLDITGVAELGFNLAGHSFTYYAQNSGTGDFRLGISGTYLSAWKAGITYFGFAGAATRQPLADRDFVMLSLERTF